MVPRRLVACLATVPVAVVLVAALGGCTPLSLFASWGGPAAPSHRASQTPDAAPTPTPRTTPLPTASSSPSPSCTDRAISQPGTYRVGNCENLTVSGPGITVTAGNLGTLTVKGDSLQVYAQSIGALEVDGDLNRVQTTDQMGTILVTGSRNMIACHAGAQSAVVNGDDNTVRVDGGFDGDVQNNGQRNSIGAQP